MPPTPTKKTRIEKAFCYRSGHVEFGNVVPSGAIFLMQVPNTRVREQIQALCQRSKANADIFITGVPEAENDQAALAAVEKFVAAVEWTLLPENKRENVSWEQYIKDRTDAVNPTRDR